jgi:hypothetical protein
MTHDPSPDIDRCVREAFGTDPDAVERITTGALADHCSRRPRGWSFRIAVAGAVVAVTAATAATVVLWPVRPVPDVVTSSSWSGSLTDGVLVVSLPDGSTSIFGPNVNEDRPPDGFGIVLVEGEVK